MSQEPGRRGTQSLLQASKAPVLHVFFIYEDSNVCQLFSVSGGLPGPAGGNTGQAALARGMPCVVALDAGLPGSTVVRQVRLTTDCRNLEMSAALAVRTGVGSSGAGCSEAG